MLGAIAGDIFCAAYEFDPYPFEEVDLFARPRFFTDDTVLTIATADALMTDHDYARAYREWGRRYPDRSYGGHFYQWLNSDHAGPYNSFGNGSAMRVSPIGWAFDSLDETLAEAARSAAVTHNHPEGIKGAQATAAAIYLARTGASKDDIRSAITDRFGYDLDRTTADIRPTYCFDITCQGAVPEALIAFLDAEDFAHTLRLVISLGGDADTQAAIAGAVAEAYWGAVPSDIQSEMNRILTDDMKRTIDEFGRSIQCHPILHDRSKNDRRDSDPPPARSEDAETIEAFLERVGSADKKGPRTMFGATPDDVRIWVEENEVRCDPQHTTTIRDIEFNWHTLRGTCTVLFDGEPCAHKADLGYDITGRLTYGFPFFHSPLGAPCSYSAYSLSAEANAALRQALDSVFPKIRALGRQKDTGHILHSLNSTNRDRWPAKEILDKAKQLLADPDLEITVRVDDDSTGSNETDEVDR